VINYKIVINVIGVLIILLGAFMLLGLPFSFYYGGQDAMAISFASLTTILSGTTIWWLSKAAKKTIKKREGYLIVVLGWISVSIFSMLPYLFSGALPNVLNALFESISGLTTTGATVITDLREIPKGILFWRSLTQWLGGMGIIVLTVAIFPILGIGGVELFVAEAPGPTSDKIHPRIKETAKRLWFIYIGLTILLTIILSFSGMTFYDAINHGLTTMATGGFSTKNESIAYFQNPAIHYWITLFMFIAGTNYTIIYLSLNGKFKKVWRSDEFKTYLMVVLFLILGVTLSVFKVTNLAFLDAFRVAAFQIISVITTTGFVSADYTSWAPGLSLLFFILLFMGASAGSTSGGIKVIRHLVFVKNSFLEFKRLLHPKAIIRIKIDKQIVRPRILTHILVFLLLYLMLFVIGTVIMAICMSNYPDALITSMGAVATSLGNVGPSIGSLGPLDNFALIPSSAKVLSIILMLLGRLEIFTILILFTPYFWRKN
jgi:trk system potassium uptake protein TrkH